MARWAAAVLALAAAAGVAVGQQAKVLTLEEAVRTAKSRQPQIRQAQAAVDAAQASVDQARAPLLPQVGLNAGYQRGLIVSTRAGTDGGVGLTSDRNSFNANLGVNQLLWDFGQTTGRWRARQALASAVQSNEKATELQIVFLVSSVFFDARANKSLVGVAQENFDNQRRHLEQIDAFVTSGVRPDIDLFQARTDLANAQVQLINAENAYAVSRAQLNQAMGIEGPIDYDVADEALPALPGEDGTAEQLMAEAMKTRPELASFAEQVRAQQLTIQSIEGAYGPAIFANAGISQTRPAVDEGWNAVAGVNLSWPIFQGGLTKAQVREAEANLVGARAQLDNTRLQIRLELDQARLALRAAKAALGAAGEALRNARERLKLAEGRYETGIGSIIELGDAQVALTLAASQAVQADYRVAAARAQLAKALGRP